MPYRGFPIAFLYLFAPKICFSIKQFLRYSLRGKEFHHPLFRWPFQLLCFPTLYFLPFHRKAFSTGTYYYRPSLSLLKPVAIPKFLLPVYHIFQPPAGYHQTTKALKESLSYFRLARLHFFSGGFLMPCPG